MNPIQYKVLGMSCQKCVRHVANTFEDQGSQSAEVDLSSAIATVVWSESEPAIDSLTEAFAEEGYQLSRL